MNDETEHELIISVSFDDFVTRFDLDEILGSIDRIIEQEIFWGVYPKWLLEEEIFGPFYEHRFHQPRMTYLGIRSINSGSLIIGAFIGGAVLTYVGTRFARGVDESLFADELKRSGRITGDSLGRMLSRINDWAERYVNKQREKGGNVRAIKAQAKSDDDQTGKNS